ncbi:Diacylglycerol acyltransferase [Macleaya cordata]|uniref:Diacylglycerol acyltransferase n=1 Tax=Macleaya cordata TaxID=56857 RepID=A0A200QGQ4_MACCD|nr:Diacylglycerol acyltransferase [Macleaya cordata]
MAATVVALNYFSPVVSSRRKTSSSSSSSSSEAGGGFKANRTVSTYKRSALSSSTEKAINYNNISHCSSGNDGRSLEKKKKKLETAGNNKISKQQGEEAASSLEDDHHHQNFDDEIKRLKLKKYIEETKDLIRTGDGGPPRWFSPLESGKRWKDSPLLLYLPGMDGVGLELISQHQRLGKVFDIWCLHIPVQDRTPFRDLVRLVDRTVKEENGRSPNRPIYLVGESIGGCLALAVAARNPTIDLMLILANPATSFRKSQLRNLVPFVEAIPEQLHIGFPYILAAIIGDPLRMALASGQRELPLPQTIRELSENLSALLSSIPVLADALPRESLLWKLKMLESASSFANSCVHAVKAQTLILASGRDQLLPSLEEAERLSGLLPTCQIRNFKDSRHALFMEDDFDLVTVIKGAGFYRRTRNVDYVSDFIPPTPSEFKQVCESYRWLDIAVNPVMLSTLENGKIVRGLAGIPSEGPVVLVGYHMLMGFDLGPLVTSFLSKRNILVRGIAHPLLFQKEVEQRLPDSSTFDVIRVMGSVPVSASNFYRLLATKSHVLLYPGGVREALHRKGEENKLFWPSQSEFVRVAARFGAKIVPFGVVGEDDLMDVLLDYDDQMRIPFFKAQIEDLNDGSVTRLRTDAKEEVGKQELHVPVLLPKLPGRFYFLFGKTIETEGRKNELRDKENAHELYMHVKSEVEKSMTYLKEKREKDPYRTLLSRIFYQASHGLTSEIPTFEL